jgi:hypothetical protein
MRTAASLGEALDKASIIGNPGDLAKSLRGVDPLAIMKIVHAAGGVSVVRRGVSLDSPRLLAAVSRDLGQRFSTALAVTIYKSNPSPAFFAALEKARAKVGR